MKSIFDYECGDGLCDTHYGLSQLETVLDGFELVSHTKLSFDRSSDTLESMFNRKWPSSEGFYSKNKILYLFDAAINGTFQALYSYDDTTLGIVIFRAK